MGLNASKDSRELTVNAKDVGVIRMSEAAVENLTSEVEAKNQPKSQQVPKSAVANESDSVGLKRIEDIEAKLIDSFKNSSKEVQQLFSDRYRTVPVCLDLQSLVKECYSKNQSHPLNCSDIAQQYNKCVEGERLNRFKGPSGA